MTTISASTARTIPGYALVGIVGVVSRYKTADIGTLSGAPFSQKTNGSNILSMVIDNTDKRPLSNQLANDDLDREIAAMSVEERVAAILAMAGTWTDLVEDTDKDWGFIDWDDINDSQQIPV